MPLKGEHSYDAEATEQQIKDLEKRIANLTETLEITVTKSIVLKIKELETELEKSNVLRDILPPPTRLWRLEAGASRSMRLMPQA